MFRLVQELLIFRLFQELLEIPLVAACRQVCDRPLEEVVGHGAPGLLVPRGRAADSDAELHLRLGAHRIVALEHHDALALRMAERGADAAGVNLRGQYQPEADWNPWGHVELERLRDEIPVRPG